MAAGAAKSNMPNRSIPSDAAMLTTSRLVEVPMVVAMPPTSVAKPIGISTPAADWPVLRHTLINMGSSKTTMGVLLTKADSTAPTTSVAAKERNGMRFQAPARKRPIGSRAPVRTRPWPTIISPQTATSASWPKPKNSASGARW